MAQFKITKAQIEAYVNNGYTVRMMAEDITNKSGIKCSDATVRNACKTYGVDLRAKKKPSAFVFDDLDIANPVPVGSTPVGVVDVTYTKVETVA